MIEVTVTASRKSVNNLLRQLRNLRSGSSELGKALLIRMGLAALGKIQQNLVEKSKGGDGVDGAWKPLAASTIAKRQWKAGKGKTGKRRREATNAQVLILRETGALFNSLNPGVSGGGISSHLPGRKAHQIFRLDPGSVTIGTNRVGALYHHEGRLPPLPQRRLWPDPATWPKGWWDTMLDQGREGLLEVAQSILSRG